MSPSYGSGYNSDFPGDLLASDDSEIKATVSLGIIRADLPANLGAEVVDVNPAAIRVWKLDGEEPGEDDPFGAVPDDRRVVPDTRGLLFNFVQLANAAPERVASFARRNGQLHVCAAHLERSSHDETCQRLGRGATNEDAATMTSETTVSTWTRYAAMYAAAVRVGDAVVRCNEPGDAKHWAHLGYGVPPESANRAAGMLSRWSAARLHIPALRPWIKTIRDASPLLRPKFATHTDQEFADAGLGIPRPPLRFEMGITAFGLDAALAVGFAAFLTTPHRSAPCHFCDAMVFRPTRRPRDDRRVICAEEKCRKANQAQCSKESYHKRRERQRALALTSPGERRRSRSKHDA